MQRRFALTFLVFVSMLVGMLPSGSARGNGHEDKWTAPSESAGFKNPYPTTPATIEKGKVLFTQQCTPCHGASGTGDGPAGEFLGKPLPDFTKADLHEQSDGELFWKLSKGKAPMPTFEDIMSEEQRWLVVDYLRTFLPAIQQGGSR